MTTPFESGALFSLPARELAMTTPPASVFPIEALDATGLSPVLRDALALVASCTPPGQPRLIVARPEMFTDGATLAWLRHAIGGVLDHVALSDGEAVRLVPGLRNHGFFYGVGRIGDLDALERLERRAPELLTQLHSQVNTALGFRWKGRRFAPRTQAILAGPPLSGPAPELRALVVDGHSPDASARLALAAAPMAPAGFARLHYLRLSEGALHEMTVARRVTALVADTLADSGRAFVWVLPEGAEDEAGRVGALMRCLLAGGGRLPRGPMANVFFTPADLSVEALGRLAARRALVVDDFVNFSRAAPGFPESFTEVLVYARRNRHMPGQFRDLMRMVYGPQTGIEWLRPYGSLERTRRS